MSEIRHARGIADAASPDLQQGQGACTEARNLISDYPGVVSPRRGMLPVHSGLGNNEGPTFPMAAAGNFKGRAFFSGSGQDTDSADHYQWGDGTHIQYEGTDNIVPPGGEFRWFGWAEARQSLYIPDYHRGVLKLESNAENNPYAAWNPGFLCHVNSEDIALSSTAGWLAPGHTVTYRFGLKITDGNGVVSISAPSGPLLVENTDGQDRSVELTVRPPKYASETAILLVWRSTNTNSVGREETVFQLQGEYAFEGLTPERVDIEDQLDVDELGESAYFNPDQRTLDRANYPPPLCKFLKTFKGSMFAFGLQDRQYAKLTPISFSANRLLIDVVTVGGNTTVTTSDTSDLAENMIFETVPLHNRRVVSIDSGTTFTVDVAPITSNSVNVFAWDTLAVTGLAGGTDYIPTTPDLGRRVVNEKGSFERGAGLYVERSFERAQTSFEYEPVFIRSAPGESHVLRGTLSRPENFVEGDRYTNNGSFVQESRRGAYTHSEADFPENFPPFLYDNVLGDVEIDPMAAEVAADKLFVFMGDGSIWYIYGDGEPSPFFQERLAGGYRLLSPQHTCTDGERVYALTDKGLVSVTEAGVQEISRTVLRGLNLPWQNGFWWGNLYWDDHEKRVHICVSEPDTLANKKHYVFATQTGTFWSWDVLDSFIAAQTPILATLADEEAGQVLFATEDGETYSPQETDNPVFPTLSEPWWAYCDRNSEAEVTAVTDEGGGVWEVTFTSTPSIPAVVGGSLTWQILGVVYYMVIIEVLASDTVRVRPNAELTVPVTGVLNDNPRYLYPVSTQLTFQGISAPDPNARKAWREATWAFDESSGFDHVAATAYYGCERTSAYYTYPWQWRGEYASGIANNDYMTTPVGLANRRSRRLSAVLAMAQAGVKWRLIGFHVDGQPITREGGRSRV